MGLIKAILRRVRLLSIASRVYHSLLRIKYYVRYYTLAWSDSKARNVPIPPSHLITLVAGNPDSGWFLLSGRLAAESLLNSLSKNKIVADAPISVLDFGCGCGRVLRNLGSLKRARLYGTDYNQELINWCNKNLTFAEFMTNHLEPPLACCDQKFDLIYGFSVFTHLPESLQLTWINELARVLKPHGYLLISTHGAHYLNLLTTQEQAQFREGQLVVREEQAAGTNICNVYHPDRFVRDRLAKGFFVVDWITEGAKGNPFQDIYLLRKLPN